MHPERLDLSLRAYRLEASYDLARGEDRSAETLGRIPESQRRRWPTRSVFWVAALSCSALAAAAIYEVPRLRAEPHSSAATRSVVLPSPIAPVANLPTAAIVPVPAPAPVATAQLAPAPIIRARSAVAVRRATVAVAEPPPRSLEEGGPSDPDDALFEEVERDHRSASTTEDLAGWQRYLAAYPEGRFAPEARYRRAEALARLGDESAALAAFLWFANNPDGSARKEDALRWVRALTAGR